MQLPRYHRLRHSFYRLEGTRCGACERSYFPPRAVCPQCRGRALEEIEFAGTGTLYSFSHMRQSPRGFANLGPYTVGMVRLDEGPLIMAQLTDVEGLDLHIGMPVQMVTRKLRESSEHGYIVYGYKFRPLLAAGATESGRSPEVAEATA
jgi:uncharacterized OB-fold protein